MVQIPKKICFSIDWLQLHCKVMDKTMLDGETSKNEVYQIVKKDIKHNVFGQHREIKVFDGVEWVVCAVISFAPLSNILPEDSLHIKIINRFLYQSDLNKLVFSLLNELKLRFKSISRLDVSADFEKFHFISVPTFIKKVINKGYLKRHSTSFHLDGKLTRSMPIHYIRFGSKESDVQFYIYNKSKELRDKTDKPYIKERWEQCGLSYKSRDIWRCEFVLHPSKFGTIDTTDGTYDFTDLKVLYPEHLVKLYATLFNQYCVFVHNDGQQRKDRMKKVELLKFEGVEMVYKRLSEKLPSNRMHKTHIKWLHQLNNAWREQTKNAGSTPTADQLLETFIKRHDLEAWFHSKFNLMGENDVNRATTDSV